MLLSVKVFSRSIVLSNESRKKHTCVCPVFEATGNCPQGSKCKLHHPKNRRKGVKRKASSEIKNGRGCYFSSQHIDITQHIAAGLEKLSVKGYNDIFLEGKFVNFISHDEEQRSREVRKSHFVRVVPQRCTTSYTSPYIVNYLGIDLLGLCIFCFTKFVV